MRSDAFVKVGEIGGLGGDTPVCDFCLAPWPEWSFPQDGEILIVDSGPFGHVSSDSWSSCDVCRPLVEIARAARPESGGVDRLAAWAAEAGLAAMTGGAPPPPPELAQYTRHLRGFYNKLILLLGESRRPNDLETASTGRADILMRRDTAEG